MNDRDWFERFASDARAAGDERRVRLVELVFEADFHRETNPDQTLALIDEGRRLAKVLDEPWWSLFYEDRRAGALMKYKGDATLGLELAVRNALEARKPLYEHFPWRFRVHDHLVVAYLHTDPVGYADEIRSALDWLEESVPDEGSPKYLVHARKRWLAAELEDLDEAERLARHSLLLAATDPDQATARSHSVFCYSHLCHVAHARGDAAELLDNALVGLELAEEAGHLLEIAEFFMWRALVAREAGDEDKAGKLFRAARRREDQLGMPPDHLYFDARCAFHEAGGELDESNDVRDRELGLLLGRGRWAAEARCRLARCELLRKTGLPTTHEVAALRAVAAKLRKPADLLRRAATYEGTAP